MGVADAGIVLAETAVPSEVAATNAPLGWARSSDRGTLLQISLNTGPKVKTTQVTNLSELKRIAQAGTLCIDLASSKNTENYELAALLASCLKVKAEDVEFIVGGKKEKASGDRQARILGLSAEEASKRLLAEE